ncbi:MAG: aldehyde ferredoxin oxidoreductase C-terminal domain-containing protein [Thermodesulfobacteriota bacterium]
MTFTETRLTHGYADKMITIDLGSGRIATPALDPDLRDYFQGGRALGLYLLHRRITAQTSPHDPENPLIFSPGPLAGVPQFPGTSKCMAISLSPLTGIPGISNFGGRFGAYLKYAGFDALEIAGRSETDVMIVIDGFRHAIDILPSPRIDEVFDLEQTIVDRFVGAGRDRKEIAFLTTGIGAARTTYGCINSHYFDPTKHTDGTKGLFRTKQAGRTGLGSVMRAKRIGAIVVLAEFPRGENPYGASDWEKAKLAGAKLAKVVREVDPQSLKMYRRGSAGLIAFMNKQEYQSLPVHNYQLGSDPRAESITGKFYADHLFDHRGMDGCFPGCNLRCTKGGWVTLQYGEHRGRRVWVDGPEYETAAGFGSNIGIWNAEFIMEANWHCDNLGIDTITSAVMIAFLMECFQRGYLTRDDTDGLELTWGNEEAVFGFLNGIASGETEFTRAAGRGMLPLVDWIAGRYIQGKGKGTPSPKPELLRFAMQTKGLPFSLYRTHRSLSMQGSYAAASDIGAHHAAAWLIKVDLLGAFPTLQDKARALITYPRVRLGNDNLGLCKLPWVDVFNPDSEQSTAGDKFINPASQEIYADFYNGMLGTDLTWEQIFGQTDRDINLQRVMNTMVYGPETGCQDWIPERAIGPIDDDLYEAERGYHDAEIGGLPGVSPDAIAGMTTGEKRERLMNLRRAQLRELIQAYYRQRGWTPEGIPTPDTLKGIGLWKFLTDEARDRIAALTADDRKNG